MSVDTTIAVSSETLEDIHKAHAEFAEYPQKTPLDCTVRELLDRAGVDVDGGTDE